MTTFTQAKTPEELAEAVVSTFLADSNYTSDVNQLAFNNIIKETLETDTFRVFFKALLIGKKFRFANIVGVFNDSEECVFDTYIENQYGDYQDVGVIDTVMGIALQRSRLMTGLIVEAEDQFYQIR